MKAYYINCKVCGILIELKTRHKKIYCNSCAAEQDRERSRIQRAKAKRKKELQKKYSRYGKHSTMPQTEELAIEATDKGTTYGKLVAGISRERQKRLPEKLTALSNTNAYIFRKVTNGVEI